MGFPNGTAKSVLNTLQSDSLVEYFDLSDGKFSVNGINLLSEVPSNVTFTPFSSICQASAAPLPLLNRVQLNLQKGGFFGFTKEEASDRLMNSLGRFAGRDFLSIFRFKTWWSTMWVGRFGSDLQMETQWMLLDVPEVRSYVIIIPIIEGSFRSALHPGTDGEVLICAESGSAQVKALSFNSIAYVHVSDNPYTLMKEAYTALRVHLNTFRLLEEKLVPSLADKFGWCTWDAFYLTVEPAGVWHGLSELVEGGVSPRFLIIDDGWQSINFDGENPNEDAKNLVLCGSQMTARLYKFEEAEKFRKYKAGTMLGPQAPSFSPEKPRMLISKAIEIEHAEKARVKALQSGITDLSGFDMKIQKLNKELNELFGGEDDRVLTINGCGSCCCNAESGMQAFTKDLRTKFKDLDDIYVWHALCGAWGGVRPEATNLNSKVIPCNVSPGLDGTMEDLAVVKIVEGGIGLVHPDQADALYDSMHSSLSKAGITGVKVDVFHTLEYVSEEYGGRVELAKAYYKGLTKSILKNFGGTGIISSMQQCNDFFFLGTEQISIGRVGDDFWFQDPNGDPMGVYWLQGVHMIHCAYNSMWIGQFIQPDWDMFQSDHLCAKFHAGSRAICGGPVYVSDSVGKHDFDLIKKLTFLDGTIPKCQAFALPTRDCLFKNPLFDQKTVLKIWNFNKYGGVIGAFNCQGAGWDPKEKRIKGFPECYKPMACSVHIQDIEWNQNKEAAEMEADDEYAVYLNQAEKILLMTPKSDPLQCIIEPSTFELFSFIPVKKLGMGIKFSPIGLKNMFNSGGTIEGLEYKEESVDEISVRVKVKGEGKFLVYSSVSPKMCHLNGVEVAFEWLVNGNMCFELPWIEEAAGVSDVAILFSNQ